MLEKSPDAVDWEGIRDQQQRVLVSSSVNKVSLSVRGLHSPHDVTTLCIKVSEWLDCVFTEEGGSCRSWHCERVCVCLCVCALRSCVCVLMVIL